MVCTFKPQFPQNPVALTAFGTWSNATHGHSFQTALLYFLITNLDKLKKNICTYFLPFFCL